ncbi:MAG: PilZ domain-containing protein [Candidatus Hodarchaeota archaeon]
MHYEGVERRKHKRFKVAIPVSIRLIDPDTGKPKQDKFKGVTTDISMGGLGLEMTYPASDLLSFAPKLAGENKEFDLNLDMKLETGDVKGVAEVRWARIPPLTKLEILTMGLFLKRMGKNAKRKWKDFVMSQSKRMSGIRKELKE